MCRNIKPLFNFNPRASQEEIELSSLQFVRKISGFAKPSKVNEAAFERAVRDVSRAARRLIDSLETGGPSAQPGSRSYKSKGTSRRTIRGMNQWLNLYDRPNSKFSHERFSASG